MKLCISVFNIKETLRDHDKAPPSSFTFLSPRATVNLKLAAVILILVLQIKMHNVLFLNCVLKHVFLIHEFQWLKCIPFYEYTRDYQSYSVFGYNQ